MSEERRGKVEGEEQTKERGETGGGRAGEEKGNGKTREGREGTRERGERRGEKEE